ncbi:MAG TPA: glycerophosphodiester phosphodiesterase [Vicinamibacterales bacterium]|nr:glycerophosphodiester phosphodiesterase [Vicinamibacterales bacterium]
MHFFDNPRPLVFAHRGGCALGPENTLAAFDLGMAAGADGLELDVHLSSDGIVVVHHDVTLDRTTDASGPIAARTAAELALVNAGNGLTVTGEAVTGAHPGSMTGVPTLRDVLRRYPGIPIIVEMKVDSPQMGHAVAQEVVNAGAIGRVCAAGFGTRSLRAVRKALPALATSASQWEVRVALYRTWAHWPVRDAPYGGYQVPERAGTLRVVSPQFIRYAHAAGFKVQVWTVDDPDDMVRLLEWGADALITNRPDLAVEVRDAFMKRPRSSS